MITEFKNLLFDMKEQLALIKNGNFENLNLLKFELDKLNYKYQKQYKELLDYFDLKDNKLSDFYEIIKIKEIKETFEQVFFLIQKDFKNLCYMIFNLIDEYLNKLKEF